MQKIWPRAVARVTYPLDILGRWLSWVNWLNTAYLNIAAENIKSICHVSCRSRRSSVRCSKIVLEVLWKCSGSVTAVAKHALWFHVTWETFSCLEQNYVSLNTVTRVIHVQNGLRLARIPQCWIWCCNTGVRQVTSCFSEREGWTGFRSSSLPPLELPPLTGRCHRTIMREAMQSSPLITRSLTTIHWLKKWRGQCYVLTFF